MTWHWACVATVVVLGLIRAAYMAGKVLGARQGRIDAWLDALRHDDSVRERLRPLIERDIADLLGKRGTCK